MISQYIDIIINYLNTNSIFLLAYLPVLIFFIALMESTPVLGTLTPGTLFLLFFGFTAFVLDANIPLMIFAATIGSIMGDILAYLLGKYGTDFLLKHKKLLKISHIEEGRAFFSNHGFKSILIGKFIGPIRSILPLIAGSINLKFSKFIFYNIISSFTWITVYIIIGFYFGYNFKTIEKYTSNISIILTILIFIYLIYHYNFKKGLNKKHEN